MRPTTQTVCFIIATHLLLASCRTQSSNNDVPTGGGSGGSSTLETRFEIQPAMISAESGGSVQLKLVKISPNGETSDLSQRARWDSSDLTVAIPANVGTMDLVGGGSAIITATVDGNTASAQLQSKSWAPVAATVGGLHTCVILENRSVRCWGWNSNGQLGTGDNISLGEFGATLVKTPKINLGTGRSAKMITAGMHSNCALLDDDSVKCWGSNYGGGLGNAIRSDVGDEKNEMGDNLPAVNLGTGRKAKMISTGDYHTCAILDNNSVKCWGRNLYGQLGLGDSNDRGLNLSEMGDNLPTVNLGTGRTAKSIVASTYHTCAILDDDTVKCWGSGGNSGTGLGVPTSGFNPSIGDAAGEMGDNLRPLNFGSGKFATMLASRNGTTCAVLNDGTLRCWPLTTPDANGDRFVKYNLGTGRKVKQLSLGFTSFCALLDTDRVKCWGKNSGPVDAGVLGLGDTFDRYDPSVLGDALPYVELGAGRTVKSISSGGYRHTCAILDNNKMKCWGNNLNGQLGIGGRDTPGDEPNEMGDQLPYVILP